VQSVRKLQFSIFAAGGALTLALYGYILYYQSTGISKGALAMPSMGMKHIAKFWSFPVLQASGLVAILAAGIAVFFGLQQSSKEARWVKMKPVTVDVVHRSLSLLALGLVIVHVVATAFDAMGDGWRTVLWINGWSKNWPAANYAYNIGVIAFYLILILGPTYYLRNKIGVRRWKFLHRFIVVFYVLSLWHALILGLDIDGYSWIRPVLWLAQLPLLWFFFLRMKDVATKSKSPVGKYVAYAFAAIALLGGLAVIGILVTGKWGFIANV
jgi:predicted ferric reductase